MGVDRFAGFWTPLCGGCVHKAHGFWIFGGVFRLWVVEQVGLESRTALETPGQRNVNRHVVN